MATPGRDDLARDLRELVGSSGMLPAEVARRTGISEATISRYLNNKVSPSPTAVARIVATTGSTGTERAEQVIRLAEDLRDGAASRVVVLRSGTATSQRRFAAIEADTAHVATFTPLIVPGLLQIEPYVRAVFASGGRPGTEAEQNIHHRLSRQRLLDDQDHRFTQVMTEGALRWHVGGPEVMAAQLDHIARQARTDTAGRVRIGIIPWTTPTDLFPLTNFDLYDDDRAVVIGTNFGTNFLDRPRDVATYVDQFRRLCELAVFDAGAAGIADRIGRDYRTLITGSGCAPAAPWPISLPPGTVQASSPPAS